MSTLVIYLATLLAGALIGGATVSLRDPYRRVTVRRVLAQRNRR